MEGEREMSGSVPTVDLSRLVSEHVNSNKILSGIQQQLASGIIQPGLPNTYATVAGLPTTGIAAGQPGWVNNGRLPGQGPSAGTGCPIFFNSATSSWYSYCTGTAVTA